MNLFFSRQVGERIRVILDCDDNTLAFERNYEFLGVAFRGKFFLLICNRGNEMNGGIEGE